MAVPIADDWKAINDRMQQIQAERFAVSRRCVMCSGLGWIPEFSNARRPREARVVPCIQCRNPKDLAPPEFVPRR